MKPVIIGCSEIKPQSELGGQELPERDVSETKVFRHHCHLGVAFPAGCKELPCLVPHLIGTHLLTKELVGDPLDRDINLRYFRVIEGLRVAKGCCAVTSSKSIKTPFMLQAGTLRLIFQRVSLLSLLIFRCLKIRS